jgi:hypothetical protein
MGTVRHVSDEPREKVVLQLLTEIGMSAYIKQGMTS